MASAGGNAFIRRERAGGDLSEVATGASGASGPERVTQTTVPAGAVPEVCRRANPRDMSSHLDTEQLKA